MKAASQSMISRIRIINKISLIAAVGLVSFNGHADSKEIYKVVRASGVERIADDLTLEVNTNSIGKTFSLKSSCREISGNMVELSPSLASPVAHLASRDELKTSNVTIDIQDRSDRCDGTDPSTLRAFLRFSSTSKMALKSNGLELSNARGQTLHLEKNSTTEPLEVAESDGDAKAAHSKDEQNANGAGPIPAADKNTDNEAFAL